MKTLAHFFSNVFQPLLIPTYCIILLFCTDSFDFVANYHKYYTVFVVFMLTAGIPILFIGMLKWLNIISSVLLSNRRERTVPYIFTVLCYLIMVYLLYLMAMPGFVVLTFFASLLAVVTVLLINLRWKISAHLCGMGSLCGAILVVSLYLGLNAAWVLAAAIVLSGCVAAARLVLKAHTPMQTVAGFLTGFLFIVASYFVQPYVSALLLYFAG